MDPIRILVVDDEPGMRSGVRRTLRGLSLDLPDIGQTVEVETAEADDGEKALAMIQADPPDLMLLDHRLPGVSGLEILERFDVRAADMLVVMITAYASLETAVNATKRGAYDFLAKPFTPAELKAVVRKAARHLILQREARRLAEEKRQVRFQFISVLAHELKAPIAAIDGYLKLIQDRVAGDDLNAYDRMIERSAIRLDGMRKLIFDLLDLTRIESGQKNRRLAEIDLRQAAEHAADAVAAAAAEREIAIALTVPEGLTMFADAGEIEIILNNLLSNAVKYNRDGGRVDATIEADDDTVTVTVADTGIGMSADEVAGLFEEFSRVKNEKTRDILGSGLGLSILKRLANLNGGDVSVASEPDVGTTFTVTLKRRQQAATGEEAA